MPLGRGPCLGFAHAAGCTVVSNLGAYSAVGGLLFISYTASYARRARRGAKLSIGGPL